MFGNKEMVSEKFEKSTSIFKTKRNKLYFSHRTNEIRPHRLRGRQHVILCVVSNFIGICIKFKIKSISSQ